MCYSKASLPVDKDLPQQDGEFDYNKIIPGSWDDENVNRACDVWSLSPNEINQLKDLQRRLSDVSYWKNEPHHILWFMKGPLGFTSSSIEHHFRKMVKWRQENGNAIDHLITRYDPPPLQVQNTICSILNDEDREGDPIYVERGGAINPVQVLKQSSKEEMVQFAIWIRELHMRGPWKDEYERRHGHTVKNITIIYDLKGMSTAHLHPRVLGVFKDVIQLTKEYYSAPVKRMIIIRAPALFRMGWALVKHIFPAPARKKMIFAGDDYLDVLDHFVNLDVLPPCINPVGHGCTAIGMPKMIGECDPGQKKGLVEETQTTSTCSFSEASDSEDLYSVRVQLRVTSKKILGGKWEDGLGGSTIRLHC